MTDVRWLLDQQELDDPVHTMIGGLDVGDWDSYGRCFAPDVELVLPQHAEPGAPHRRRSGE